jgi:hypothetical protein
MPPRRVARGPAARSERLASEANLTQRFRLEMPFTVGAQTDRCQGCGAFRWKLERRQKDARSLSATFNNCCRHGDVALPLRYFPLCVDEPIPQFFRELLRGNDLSTLCISQAITFVILIGALSRIQKVSQKNSKVQQRIVVHFAWHDA